MPLFEYAVQPAPLRGEKAKGLKTPTDRFAHAVAGEINRMAAEGWEYVRAETLPSEERSELTGRATVYHNLLVFRRPLAELQEATAQIAATAPQPEYPASATPAATPEPTPDLPRAAAPQPSAGAAPTAAASAPDWHDAGADTAETTPEEAAPPAPRQSPDR